MRLKEQQIEFLQNEYEYIPRSILLSLQKDNRTRGHKVTLVKEQSRLDIRKYSLSQKTINEWNKLSTDCVNARSVNMFKTDIDKYIKRAGYTQMKNCCTFDKPMTSLST